MMAMRPLIVVAATSHGTRNFKLRTMPSRRVRCKQPLSQHPARQLPGASNGGFTGPTRSPCSPPCARGVNRPIAKFTASLSKRVIPTCRFYIGNRIAKRTTMK
jgi:hypothetical protein